MSAQTFFNLSKMLELLNPVLMQASLGQVSPGHASPGHASPGHASPGHVPAKKYSEI